MTTEIGIAAPRPARGEASGWARAGISKGVPSGGRVGRVVMRAGASAPVAFELFAGAWVHCPRLVRLVADDQVLFDVYLPVQNLGADQMLRLDYLPQAARLVQAEQRPGEHQTGAGEDQSHKLHGVYD